MLRLSSSKLKLCAQDDSHDDTDDTAHTGIHCSSYHAVTMPTRLVCVYVIVYMQYARSSLQACQ